MGGTDGLGGLTGAGVRVGHLDSGVDLGHPALASRVVERRYFARDGLSSFPDEQGDTAAHGTYTAGLLAGCDAGHGFTGVAPGAQLLAGTVIEGGEVVARIVTGLDWLLGQGVRLACLPLGVPPSTALDIVLRIVRERGMLVVAPIGNEGAGRYLYPGGCAHALSVGAGLGDQVARFSGSHHDQHGRCLAPSLVAPGCDLEGPVSGGGYETRSGTSAAAATLTGIIALMLEAVPEATSDAVVRALCTTAIPPTAAQAHRCTAGFVDAAAAASALAMAPDVRRPETSAATPRVDQRLTAALARDQPCTAIAVYSDPAARSEALVRLDDSARVIRLDHLPVAVVRARPADHARYLGAAGTLAVASADADRMRALRTVRRPAAEETDVAGVRQGLNSCPPCAGPQGSTMPV